MPTAALLDAAERVVWTFVQAFLAVLVASPVFDNLGLDWESALKIALFAGLASVAKSLLAIAISHNSTPQLGVTTYNNENPPA
jgi:Putative lactococcus lactis phage r1t holin